MNALRVILLAAATVTGAATAADPFRTAALAPPDVRLYLHVEEAAAIRDEIADRPVARWVERTLGKGQLREACAALAADAGVDGTRLFDLCLGRGVTVLVRGRDEAVEWAVLTEVDPQQIGPLLGRLAPRVLGSKHKLAILHLPQHELLLARSGRMLLVGPYPRSSLFYELVSNLTAPPASSLGSLAALAAARELGGGRLGLMVRHEPPMGGWSVAVADIRGPRVEIRHAARFDDAPFTGGLTALQWDMAPLKSLEEPTILAFVEPTDTGGGLLEGFVTAWLGEAAMTAEMRANLGPRRITTLADFDGRLEDPPFDLLFPTLARVYEVKDPAAAWAQLDRQMILLVERLSGLGPDLDVPAPATFSAGEPRRVQIGALAKWLLGDLPGAERVSLNWAVVAGSEGESSWCIIATHPDHLRAVSEAIARPPAAPRRGAWASCGTADGRRLAEHLRSWRDQHTRLAAPPDAEAFRDALAMFSELAEGVDRCRWRLARPAVNRMRLEAELILSPPDSTR